MRVGTRIMLVGAAVAAPVVAGGCGENTQADASGDAEAVETEVMVLASTDVYASLVEGVVADAAEVAAIVNSTAVDPHSYEATPQDRLSVQEADVLVANGGGYDPYITQLADAADKEDSVFQLISGENWHSHEFDGTYENEHIWYDLAEMSAFVVEFSEHMGELDPQNAEFYDQNAQALAAEITSLDDRNRSIGAEGLTYLATEAVSGFLLEDAGFEDLTDIEFLSAVEHGDEVAPRLFFESVDAVTTGEVDLLSYNPQTETNQSLQIREAAQENSVEVLNFQETLPEGVETYTEWMEQNITVLEDAVMSLNQ